LRLAHNGNLTNTDELESLLRERDSAEPVPHKVSLDSTNDTSLVSGLFGTYKGVSLWDAALDLLPRLVGAYCLVFMTENALYAARDPQGIHPLVLGRLENGWVVASETAALDMCRCDVHPRDRTR